MQVAPALRGFGTPLPGCPTCRTQDARYTYALGVILSGDWLLQTPSFYGYAGVMAYLPARRLAVAAAVTFTEAGFDEQGNYRTHNAARDLFAAVAAELAPEAPVPA